jgi:hypothetical protein
MKATPGTTAAAGPAEPPPRIGLDWVWRHWLVQLLGGAGVAGFVLDAVASGEKLPRLIYALSLTACWLLVGVVHAAVSRGRARWFIGLTLAMLSPILVLIGIAETGRLPAALLCSSVLVMLTIAMCPRTIAIAAFAAGWAVALTHQILVGHLGAVASPVYLVQLTAAYAALATIALAWRVFLERLRAALRPEAPPPVLANPAAPERDRLREAVILHLRKVDALLEQAGAPGQSGSG